MALFPKGTMRKSGVGLIAIAAPAITIGLKMAGIGEECTPEAVETGCVGAAEISGFIVAAIGGVLYWIGFNRAQPKE